MGEGRPRRKIKVPKRLIDERGFYDSDLTIGDSGSTEFSPCDIGMSESDSPSGLSL